MLARTFLIVLCTAFAACNSVASETPKPAHGAEAAKPEAHAGEHEKADDPASDPFCDGIVDAAREKRYYLKQQELKALLIDVDKRLATLNERKTEYEEWVRRREDFANRATKNLIEIYANMKPEASAVRLAALESELAASLLLAISPRQASAILNEMDEKVAASLTGIMAASARQKDPS